MKQIGETIVEAGIKDFSNLKERSTVRAVIIKDQKVCMLYSEVFDDYTFPGGGVKASEDHGSALIRELDEELGARGVLMLEPIGYTEEIRYGINQNESTYRQRSYYYLCKVDEFADPSYNERESSQGLKIVWVDPKSIILHNQRINATRNGEASKGLRTVLIRENTVLQYLLEHYINA